jgi:hypothetical protein
MNMLAQEVVIRRATAEDALRISRLFQVTYGDSSHPCKDECSVYESICSGANTWRIAIDQDELVACVTLIHNRWNRSCEIGRGITLREYRGEGLATTMMQQSLNEAFAYWSCDVMIGFPRNQTMLNIALERLAPHFMPVGHDGAINVANGIREYHAITLVTNPRVSFCHYIPRSWSWANSDFVQHKIVKPLGLRPMPGDYPPLWVVGSGVAQEYPEPFSFDYDPFCLSNSLEITGCHTNFSNATEAANALLHMLEGFDRLRHTRVTALVDKAEFIRHLIEAGFELTAYLPAWYRQGNARFDCVLLVRGNFCEEPTDHGIRSIVDEFRSGLQSVADVLCKEGS